MNLKQKQLELELDLILQHFKVPVEDSRKRPLATQQAGLLTLQQQLSSVDPDVAILKLNELLKKTGYPHQATFLSDAQAKSYIMNHPAITLFFAMTIHFLAMPLRPEIDISQVVTHRDALAKITQQKTLTAQDGIQAMEHCCALCHLIADILEACKNLTHSQQKKPGT